MRIANGYLYATEEEMPGISNLKPVFSSYNGGNPLERTVHGIEEYLGDKREISLYKRGQLMPAQNIIMAPVAPVVFDPYTRQVVEEQQYPVQQQRGFKLPNRILGIDKNVFLVLCGVALVLIFTEMFQRKH
jgi:hypothetical protein